jgi:hypothetical protein
MLPEWISSAEAAYSILRAIFPQWENVEVRFAISSAGLGFRCNDKGLGDFRVWVVDDQLNDIAYIEGKNSDKPSIQAGYNVKNFTHDLLEEIFQMARYRREMERVRNGSLELAGEYMKPREAVIQKLAQHTQPSPPTRKASKLPHKGR